MIKRIPIHYTQWFSLIGYIGLLYVMFLYSQRFGRSIVSFFPLLVLLGIVFFGYYFWFGLGLKKQPNITDFSMNGVNIQFTFKGSRYIIYPIPFRSKIHLMGYKDKDTNIAGWYKNVSQGNKQYVLYFAASVPSVKRFELGLIGSPAQVPELLDIVTKEFKAFRK